MGDISNMREVAHINNARIGAYPVTTTEVFDTSLGDVVVQSETHGPELQIITHYGVVIKEVPWNASRMGESYALLLHHIFGTEDPRILSSKPTNTVYIVKKDHTEEEKGNLAKVLREECGVLL